MNFSRFAAAGVAAMALGGALPAVASATDYCVAPNQGCGANNVGTLQDALNLAAVGNDSDRVLLGEGTYVAPPVQTAFSYTNHAAPVEIVGSGRGRTILTAQPYALDRVLYLDGGAGSSVHDLTIRIPRRVNQDFRGLLTRDIARRVEIVADPDQVLPFLGVLLDDGGTFEDSTVTLSTEQDTTGISAVSPVAGGRVDIRNSAITARTGVDVWGYATVERSRVTGGNLGIRAHGGETTVRDSLVDITWLAGTGMKAQARANWDAKITADGVTVIGANTPDVSGVGATTAGSVQNAAVALTNSVIRVPFNAVYASATSTGTAKVSASFSDYDASGNIAFGPGASIDETHVTNVGDAGFVDAAGGDYRLRAGSPLVDLGEPDVPQGLDLDGNARVADGNGDGYARRDIGAFELQPAAPPAPPATGPAPDTQPPVISGFRAARSRLAVARGTRFSYRLSENARVTLRLQRAGRHGRYRTLAGFKKTATAGVNTLRFRGRIHRRALRPGRYRAVITAIDAAGNRSTARVTPFRVIR